MIYDDTITGAYIKMRSVLPQDAEATLRFRQDPEKTRFLHPVENDLSKQLAWIEKQNQRPGDFFFLALDLEERPIGTFGLFDIEGREGHSGRLISYGNAMQSFELNILLFRFAFECMNLEIVNGDVTNENIQAIRLDEMFGFQFEEAVQDTDLDRMVRYCHLTKEDFYENVSKINKMVYRKNPIPRMPWEE